ncbi:hypothetical protein PVK06_048474 [Gossypium arboreum]|uniref:Uncharacterized protein n=1 Tax=Gossypium arboreum TaxID=29729 RepID=A0ABR0MFZ6_GOSAR|nr:hypothetical protein PVK06_048474 [Gossypium arboreum]
MNRVAHTLADEGRALSSLRYWIEEASTRVEEEVDRDRRARRGISNITLTNERVHEEEGCNLVRSVESGSISEIGWVTKKVRRQTDVALDFVDPVVDVNGKKVQVEYATKFSYKATLLGANSIRTLSNTMGDDFLLQVEDVAIEIVDGIPLITFSE